MSSSSLKERSRSAALLTFGSQAVKFFLKILSAGALARHIAPSDFGLLAMTTTLSGFLGIFKDAGLTQATVRMKTISEEQLSNVFWINGAIGIALALVTIGASPGLAWFFNDTRIIEVACWMAIPFAVGGFAVQHNALLRRELRFGVITLADLVSTLVGTTVGVFFAIRGHGYHALIYMNLSTAFLACAIQWWAARWLPRWFSRQVDTRALVKFGADIVAFDVVNYFARQSDNLLIGWKWGPTELGYYDKAYNILLMPIRQINAPLISILIPILSKLQDQPARYMKYFVALQQMIAETTMPIVVVLALFAKDLISVWFGPTWEPTAVMFQLLAPAALVGAIANTNGALLIPLGRTKRYRKVGLIGSVVITASFLVGLPWGANGVALAYSIAFPLNHFFMIRGTLKETPVRFSDYFNAHVPALVSALVASTSAVGLTQLFLLGSSALERLIVGASVFGLSYGASLLFAFKRRAFYTELVFSKGKSIKVE